MNDYFDENEYNYICQKLHSKGGIYDVTIHYDSPGYFNRIKSVVQRDRRGEVVFCVIRPNGKVIVVTCSDYPENIYRIPTGGIDHNENVLEAIYREVYEELGLTVRIKSFCGVVRIRFEHGNEHVMFYSYIFILEEIGGNLLEDASDDEVSAVREVDTEELARIAESLRNIKGKWHDWGQFRYVTTNAVVKQLEEICI